MPDIHKKNNPFFSIIVPTYNRADLLGCCLRSILSQTYSNWEVLIIDNYSADNTQQIVQQLQDPRIRFIQTHNDGIIAKSRNLGLQLAVGEWICFLDSDDLWVPTKLEQCIKYTNEYDFIHHDMYVYHKIGTLSSRKRLNGRQLKSDNPYIDQLLNGNACINSSLVIRQSLVKKAQPIREDKELIGVEDFDFELRLMQKTHRIKHISLPLGYYYIAPSGISYTEKQAYRMQTLYDIHLHNIKDCILANEIKKRLAYRQARILQIHGNYTAAMEKYKAALQSASLSYRIRARLFSLILKCTSICTSNKN